MIVLVCEKITLFVANLNLSTKVGKENTMTVITVCPLKTIDTEEGIIAIFVASTQELTGKEWTTLGEVTKKIKSLGFKLLTKNEARQLRRIYQDQPVGPAGVVTAPMRKRSRCKCIFSLENSSGKLWFNRFPNDRNQQYHGEHNFCFRLPNPVKVVD